MTGGSGANPESAMSDSQQYIYEVFEQQKADLLLHLLEQNAAWEQVLPHHQAWWQRFERFTEHELGIKTTRFVGLCPERGGMRVPVCVRVCVRARGYTYASGRCECSGTRLRFVCVDSGNQSGTGA